ncbi:hypothetical protein M569_06711, partial [Genlisea aurea]
YCLMIKNNAAQDCFLINQYVTACANAGSIESAVFSFSQMSNPNVFVYNAMFGAFLKCFLPFECLSKYVVMLRNGVLPSSYTFPALIKSCRILSAEEYGESLHGQILKCGFGFRVHIQTVLVDFYSTVGKVFESAKVFDEISDKDEVALSTMVSAHARAGDLYSARKLFDEMPVKKPPSWNAMLQCYVEAGEVESAENLFRSMPARDAVAWTAMISCYGKHGRHREALELFDEMVKDAVRPDQVTVAAAISACAHLGASGRGKELHLYAALNGFHRDVYVASALIDMYSKCGLLERSLVVFYKLQHRNLHCWSSMIDGLAFHGHPRAALAALDAMRREKIPPNGVVFVSILSACAHSGLVDEGKRVFRDMIAEHSTPPGIQHYGCMVDLLCRVGLLDEATEVIKSMRMEPNSVIWGTLLGGCKLHKNMEMAEAAAERLTVMEPDGSGHYNLMINMNAEAGRWGEVSRIRAAMKERGVEKGTPGSSWIESGGEIRQFAAAVGGDDYQNQIYLVLEGLDSQVRLFG